MDQHKKSFVYEGAYTLTPCHMHTPRRRSILADQSLYSQ
jgi:hypothetical protein